MNYALTSTTGDRTEAPPPPPFPPLCSSSHQLLLQEEFWQFHLHLQFHGLCKYHLHHPLHFNVYFWIHLAAQKFFLIKMYLQHPQNSVQSQHSARCWCTFCLLKWNMILVAGSFIIHMSIFVSHNKTNRKAAAQRRNVVIFLMSYTNTFVKVCKTNHGKMSVSCSVYFNLLQIQDFFVCLFFAICKSSLSSVSIHL